MEKSRKRIIIFYIGLFIVVSIDVFIYKITEDISEIGKDLKYSKTVFFEKHKDSIFIQTRIWGLTGDHYQIFISDRIKKYPETGDVIFDNKSKIYYKRGLDSLHMYFPSGSYSQDTIYNKKINSINIKIVEYKKSLIKQYYNNYKKMGLLKISVYDGIE